MLKSIEKIKGLGVYHSYSKPAGTQEFGIKNLIYGWNYSGKTTLSRLFAQLETKVANPDLAGCEFTFATASDAITEKTFNHCNLSVRVFNSDFIRSNLHFDGGSFNPILLLGKESQEAQRKIDKLSKRIKLNPLADWGPAEIDAYLDRHDLPRHPLVADGFVSIGCFTCTERVAPGEDPRAGRWRGTAKTECGLHTAARPKEMA